MSGPAISPVTVIQAFHQKVGFEEVERTTITNKQIRLLLRPTDAERAKLWSAPGGVMSALLLASTRSTWSVDVSRYYFMRDTSVVWCWRVIFGSASIQDSFQEITSVIMSVGRGAAMSEVLETPLLLASANRNTPGAGSQKGARQTVFGSR